MVKGPGGRGRGRGNIGVRFDRLNELRVGEIPEPADGCHNERGTALYVVPPLFLSPPPSVGEG